MAQIVIAGCGYVGTALALQLVADGDDVFGLRRDPSGLPGGIRPLAADLTSKGPLGLPASVDHAVYCVGAKTGTEDAYRAAYVDGLAAFLAALSALPRPPTRVIFTSSTSVYAQRQGEWVDERSAVEPVRFTGRILLEAETLLGASPLPATVVRLAGIYGPGRTGLLRRVASGDVGPRPGAPVNPTPGLPLFTNRIHRDDAAGVIRFLIRAADAGRSLEELYLGVDSLPASQAEVASHLAGELGAAAPGVLGSGASVGRARAGSKRCSNARLLAAGYRFLYPTFREGYRPLIAAHLAQTR